MLKGLIGRKVGMTQIFDEGGQVIPVTVLQAGPCVVVQKKTPEREGYTAVQLGLVESRSRRRVTRAIEGHFKKSAAPPTRILREFAYEETEDEPLSVGDQIVVNQVFQANDTINIVALTKGRGFQGVMKRHGFSGGNATHGSMFHRAPGSIGQSASPSRVFPGTRGPGRMGNKRVTIRNLQVVEVDEENNLLLVKGAVPGSRARYLTIVHSGRRS